MKKLGNVYYQEGKKKKIGKEESLISCHNELKTSNGSKKLRNLKRKKSKVFILISKLDRINKIESCKTRPPFHYCVCHIAFALW